MNARSPSACFGATRFQSDAELIGPGVLLLRLAGDLDIDTSDAVSARLGTEVRAPMRAVLVDLSGVTFCSSAGISVLIQTARQAAAEGIDLRLVGVGRSVHRPLEVTGLDRYFRIAAGIDDALVGGGDS